MYTNFIGVDIGKNDLFVFNNNKSYKYENNVDQINKLLLSNLENKDNTLFIFETTGGHETKLMTELKKFDFPFHRANTRNVKNYSRSLGIKGKSDTIDAKILASYGQDRQKVLAIGNCIHNDNTLSTLMSRVTDLKKQLVQEKNRLQSPNNLLNNVIQDSIKAMITFLESQLSLLLNEIDKININDKTILEKINLLLTIPGIGENIARSLVINLPELGECSGRQIASLCGLAPHPNESGKKIGRRMIGHGRDNIKRDLYLGVLANIKSNKEGSLKSKYQTFLEKGKPKKVALVALERKLLVIINAKVHDLKNNKK